jgi:hypothetical protein
MTIQRWLLLLAMLGFFMASRVYHSAVFQVVAGLLMLTAVIWNRRGLYRR